jgi:6-phosphofructokinase 1
MSEKTHPPLPSPQELIVRTLGPMTRPSPMPKGYRFVNESERVLVTSTTSRFPTRSVSPDTVPSFEIGGPRARILFNPASTTCGIVTCGGLCPGLNDVIRSVVLTLFHHYGVRSVLGFRYGYASMTRNPFAPRWS